MSISVGLVFVFFCIEEVYRLFAMDFGYGGKNYREGENDFGRGGTPTSVKIHLVPPALLKFYVFVH